jgi:hypothetical protein
MELPWSPPCQVLVSCLDENEAVHSGQFPAALAVYMEMVKSRMGDIGDMNFRNGVTLTPRITRLSSMLWERHVTSLCGEGWCYHHVQAIIV